VTGDLFALFESTPQTAPAPAATTAEQAVAASTGQEIGLDAATMVSQTSGNDDATAQAGGAPDFSAFGFNLIAARLLSDSKGPGMQLVYESEKGSRVELYYGPDADSSKTSLVLMDEGPVSVLFWHGSGRSYSLVGEIERKTLLEMGRAVNGKWTASLPVASAPATTAEPAAQAPASGGQDGSTAVPATGTSTGTGTGTGTGTTGSGSASSTGADAGTTGGTDDQNMIMQPDKANDVTRSDSAET
jgi:hypothetical protein